MRAARSFHVAVVGSGPSGFYAAEALLQSAPEVAIDLIERLPVPFGLVRYGVAPDHQKLKEVTRVYTRLASDDRLKFFGNVTVGKDVKINELLELYDAVIVACGASHDRIMSVPGESLRGCHSAVEFVGWYNGHPDHRHHNFDLSGEVAVVVGQGNVAIDICRILAKGVDDLRKTDIADYALDTLAASRIKKILVVGRRGPAQMKITNKELRELGGLAGWNIRVTDQDLTLDPVSRLEVAEGQESPGARNIRCLEEMSSRPQAAARTIEFRFLRSPIEVLGENRVSGVLCSRNSLSGGPLQQRAVSTGETEVIAADIVFRSIGYLGSPIEGLPFDASAGIIPNQKGRVIDSLGVCPRMYVTGWIKRGPTGIIGTNRGDSIETVASLLSDREVGDTELRSGRSGLLQLLVRRGVRAVSFDEWTAIDAEEIRRGQYFGRVRSKITTCAELLSIATQSAEMTSTRPASSSSDLMKVRRIDWQLPSLRAARSSLGEGGVTGNEA